MSLFTIKWLLSIDYFKDLVKKTHEASSNLLSKSSRAITKFSFFCLVWNELGIVTVM